MAWKNVLNGTARALFTPRQLSASSFLRTRMNHSRGGFEPLFPAPRSNGNIRPPMGFGLMMEAVVAGFRSLTVVSIGLLIGDLIHGTEASHLKEKVDKDLTELTKHIKVTDKTVEDLKTTAEALKTTTEALKTSKESLMKNFLRQAMLQKKQEKALQDFKRQQEKALQDSKRKQEFTFACVILAMILK